MSYNYHKNQIEPVLDSCKDSEYKGQIKMHHGDTSTHWLSLPTEIMQKIADILYEYGEKESTPFDDPDLKLSNDPQTAKGSCEQCGGEIHPSDLDDTYCSVDCLELSRNDDY